MNDDQTKGRAKEVGGKIQKKFGELTGDEENRAKGKAKEVEGKAQKNWGDLKKDVADAIDD